jgi:predicted amidohydrolase
MATLRIGLVQLNRQSDQAANLAAIERLVGEAAARGAAVLR